MRCPTCQTENLEPRKFKSEIGDGDFHGLDCPEVRCGHPSNCYGDKEGGVR